MGDFQRVTSLFGRRLGLTSSGGLVNDSTFVAIMRNATGVIQDVMRSYVESISSSGAQAVRYGVSILATATATARAFSIQTPISGVEKRIFSQASGSVVTIETSATTILIASTGAGGGATSLTITNAAGTKGEAVTLMGLSSTLWTVASKTGGVA